VLTLNTMTGRKVACYDVIDVTMFRKRLHSVVDSAGIRHVEGMR
jgi:hypothetical protein